MRNVSQKNLLAVRVPWVEPAEQGVIIQRYSGVREAAARLSEGVRRGRRQSAGLRRALLDAAFSGRLTGRSTDTQLLDEIAAQQAEKLLVPVG